MSIRGFPSLKKIVNLIAGYTEEQSVPHNEFVTVSPVASNKKALDVKSVAITDMSGADKTPNAVSGRVITLTAHGALPGDIIKFLSGANELMEVGILSTPDANTIIIDAEIVISVSDTFRIFRAITPNVDASGNFTVAQGPIQFLKDGNPIQVTEDTVNPANNIPLPVKLTDITGDVSITAHNLNVQLSDQGANPDVTRIGDGTNQLAITAGNAAKVDGSAVTQPISVASLPLPSGAATEAKQDSEITKLTSIDGKLPANLTVTSTRLLIDGSGVTQPVSGSVSVSNFPATQPISAASLPLPTGAATEATLSALNTKVPANLTVTSTRLLVDGSGVTQPVSGSVSVSNFPATQAVSGTVAVSNLASTLGQKTMANSAAVVIASDQSAISTTPAALVASFQEVLNLTTVAQVVTPPANAKWVKVYADNTNTNNIRIRFAGTATTTSGVSLEPGRDMDFNAMNTAISIIAEAGTNQKINFTFGA